MLILIGGRSVVPALAGAIQFITDVDRVKFLVCEGEQYEEFQRRAERFIKEKHGEILCQEADIEIVNPINFGEVYNTVSNLCKPHESIKYINLTTAPQAMAIATYHYFQENCSQALIFTVSTDQAKVIPLTKNGEFIPFNRKLDIDDYIIACGGDIFKKKWASESDIEEIDSLKILVNSLVDRISLTDSIFSEIKKQSGGGDSIKSTKLIKLDNLFMMKANISKSSIFDFLDTLENALIITNLDDSRQEISFRVNSKKYSFIKGDWLEMFAFLKAKECDFDSVASGVELSGYNGEIDIFILHNSTALICECKSGSFQKADLFKLKAKGEKLGGSYCTKLFVTSSLEISEEFANEAKSSNITLLTAKDLPYLAERLQQEMQEPKYKRR